MQKKLLIIEDNPSLIKAIKAKFENSQYRVVYAMDGEEGLIMFEKNQPDLVLLDIAMPKKDGFEVLEEIRQNLHSNVPVVILSNSKDKDMIDRAKQFGISKYLLKAETALASLVLIIDEILKD